MNKKAQLDIPIIAFFVVIVGLIILAPVMLRIFHSIQTPLSNQFGNLTGLGGEVAQTNFNKVMDTGAGFWDEVIVFAFFFGILALVISSVMIDTHPLFIFSYIFIAFMLILFSGNIINSLSVLYGTDMLTAAESNQLSIMSSLIDNYGIFMVGIIIFTGIIMYGKVAFFNKGLRGASRK